MAFKSTLGVQVDRPVSIIPQTVVTPGTPYFTIATGMVLVTGLVGIFTVGVGGICSAQWCLNPTTGTDTNICGATVITACVAGGILTVSGVATEGMLPLNGGAGQLLGGIAGGGGRGIVMVPGALGVFTTASMTGNWIWHLWYIPIDAGATVVAV